MKSKLLTLLLIAAAIVSMAQPATKIWFNEGDLRTGAIRNFATGQYLDCIMNCQRMIAQGNADGLVTGLMAMAYDSLTNDEAAQKAKSEAAKFQADQAIIARMAASDLSPEIYKRTVMRTGADFYNTSKFDSSEAYFNQYLVLSPKDTFALFFLANSQFYQGKYEQAVANYKKVLELDFQRADVHNLVGVCYMLQNNYLSARDYFSQAVLLDKNMGVAYYNIGRVQFGLNDKTAALQNLNTAYSLSPKDSNIVALLSQIYLEQQDWKNAEKYLAKMYALNRNNEKVGWNLVNIAKKNNDYEHAAAYLQNIIRTSPKNPQGYNELSDVYITMGSYEQAFNNYENAITKLGESRDLLYGAGMCANKIGIFGKAVEYLSKAITNDASYAKSYKELGDAYMGLGKKKNAKKSYKMANSLGYIKEQQPTSAAPQGVVAKN